MSTYPACDPADGGMYAWVADDKYDMEEHLDRNYRKHLDKQVNKLLLRIRMLFYINYEVLDGIRDRCRASDIKARSVLSTFQFLQPKGAFILFLFGAPSQKSLVTILSISSLCQALAH